MPEEERKKSGRAERVRSILGKLSVPQFLVPRRFLVSMELMLANANISFSAREWMGIFFAIGVVLFVVVSLLVNLFAGIGAFLFTEALMLAIPRMQADKRRAEIEEALPDALHHMAVSIRTGMVLEAVIQEIAEAEYGALSDEFAQITLEMRRGRPLKDALLAFSKRTGSKQIERAMRLLLEGIESGGPISEVLEEVSEDIRAVRMIQRERKSLTSQQVSFLAMASLMAGPFVMGVVGALPTIMTQAMAGTGGTEQFPLEEINSIMKALSFYVFAQAVSGGIMMGVVMYGDFKKGFKFALPMGVVAYLVFYGVKKLMPGMLAAF
ncbi:MAG: type II secretion system F family protein [Euryarchaeota archaeon]|nr:type II secretion system F family protein [Euryarchaeota archaeon]